MENAKVIELLKSFDATDWRECNDFLKGRLRKGHDCIILYEYIKKYRSSWNSRFLRRKEIKERNFNQITEKSFTNVLSKLALNLEDYLVFSQVKKEPKEYKLALLRAISSRGLFPQFERAAIKFEKEILYSSESDIFDSLHLLQLNHLRFFSENPIKNEIGDTLLLDLVRRSSDFHNHYSMLVKTIQIHLNELSVKYNKNRYLPDSNSHLVEVLNLLYQFKKDKEESVFQNLYTIIIDQKNGLSSEINKIILDIIIQDGLRRISKGDLSFSHELLNLYEYGLQRGLLASNGRISEIRFINIISAACVSDAVERAEVFIENYSSFLNSEIRASLIVFSQTLIDFYKGLYESVVDNIRDHYFSSLRQNIMRRWILLCSFYKLYVDDSIFIESQIKNYNNFFYNNRCSISEPTLEGSLNLSKIIHHMSIKSDQKKIRDHMGKFENLVMRSWLQKETGM